MDVKLILDTEVPTFGHFLFFVTIPFNRLIDWLVEILDFCIIFNEKKYNFCSYRASIRNTFAMSGVINERITTRKFFNQHEIDGKDKNYRKWSFSNI